MPPGVNDGEKCADKPGRFPGPLDVRRGRSARASSGSARVLSSTWAESAQEASTANMPKSAGAVAPVKKPKFAFKAFQISPLTLTELETTQEARSP
jgi:hypothetical protein